MSIAKWATCRGCGSDLGGRRLDQPALRKGVICDVYECPCGTKRYVRRPDRMQGIGRRKLEGKTPQHLERKAA